MFSVLAEGPGRYRLEDGAGTDVGWIHGRSIGLRGLRSEAEAIVAASAGWRTLQSVLRREHADWPHQSVEWERLRFVDDGAYEWVSDGYVPLARVHRTTRRLAVEFVVPSWMTEDAMIPLAHALWHTLTPLLGDPSNAIGDARRASSAPTLSASSPAHRRFEHVHDSGFHPNAVTRRHHAVAERQRGARFTPPDGGTAA
jgi:hypothetical protein